MNERIKELVEQAEDWADNQNFYASDYRDYLMEKFAELIVRECMKINKVETTALDLPEYNLGMLEGYRRARENISIHFGVEE